MNNLKFIEIKNNKKEKDNFSYENGGHVRFNTFSFMTTLPKDTIEIEDVTDEIIKNTYTTDCKYTLIYLYDYIHDAKSIEFLEKYGARLHNLTSANISILTFLDEGVSKSWKNIANRNKLNPIDYDDQDVIRTINKLKRAFKVNRLPSLILICNSLFKDDVSISLEGYEGENIYDLFKEINNIVLENYEESFAKIRDKINTANDNIKRINDIHQFNNSNFIDKLLKENDINQIDLSEDLRISDRTLRNKIANSSFTKEEIIYMAFRFKLDLFTLNKLLNANGRSNLGGNKRENIIKRCIENKLELDETNKELISERQKSIEYNSYSI